MQYKHYTNTVQTSVGQRDTPRQSLLEKYSILLYSRENIFPGIYIPVEILSANRDRRVDSFCQWSHTPGMVNTPHAPSFVGVVVDFGDLKYALMAQWAIIPKWFWVLLFFELDSWRFCWWCEGCSEWDSAERFK